MEDVKKKLLKENKEMEDKIWDLLSNKPEVQKTMILSTMVVISAHRARVTKERFLELMTQLYDMATKEYKEIVN
jgi:hypothetical protein